MPKRPKLKKMKSQHFLVESPEKSGEFSKKEDWQEEFQAHRAMQHSIMKTNVEDFMKIQAVMSLVDQPVQLIVGKRARLNTSQLLVKILVAARKKKNLPAESAAENHPQALAQVAQTTEGRLQFTILKSHSTCY